MALSIVGTGVWLVAKDPSITKALRTAAITPASAGWLAPTSEASPAADGALPKFKVQQIQQIFGNSIRVTSIGEEPVTVLAFVINNRSGVNGCDSKVRQQDLQKNLDAAAEAAAEAVAEAERQATAAKAKAHSLQPAARAAEAKARAAAVQPARREAAEAARAAAQAKADALEPLLKDAEALANWNLSHGMGADWGRVEALRRQIEEAKKEATSRPPDVDWTGVDRMPVVFYQKALRDANKAREAASAGVQAGAQQKQDIIERDLQKFGPKLPVRIAQGDTLTLPVSDACGAEIVQVDLHTDRGDVKYGLTD